MNGDDAKANSSDSQSISQLDNGPHATYLSIRYE